MDDGHGHDGSHAHDHAYEHDHGHEHRNARGPDAPIPVVSFLSGSRRGDMLRLGGDRLTIGTAAESDIRLPEDTDALSELTASEAFAARDAGTLSEVYRVAFRSTLKDRTRVDELELDLSSRTARNGQDVARLLGSSMASMNWWDRLGTIGAPTLVLSGRYDAAPLEMGQALAEAFPVGTFEALDTGHFPYIEDRQSLVAAIAGFVLLP